MSRARIAEIGRLSAAVKVAGLAAEALPAFVAATITEIARLRASVRSANVEISRQFDRLDALGVDRETAKALVREAPRPAPIPPEPAPSPRLPVYDGGRRHRRALIRAADAMPISPDERRAALLLALFAAACLACYRLGIVVA